MRTLARMMVAPAHDPKRDGPNVWFCSLLLSTAKSTTQHFNFGKCKASGTKKILDKLVEVSNQIHTATAIPVLDQSGFSFASELTDKTNELLSANWNVITGTGCCQMGRPTYNPVEI
jgi:hypothetical protein